MERGTTKHIDFRCFHDPIHKILNNKDSCDPTRSNLRGVRRFSATVHHCSGSARRFRISIFDGGLLLEDERLPIWLRP